MFAKEVYVNRRNTLKTKVSSGILLFLGTGEAAVNYAGNAYRYRQDSTFNYYFGLTDPDLAAVIDLESGEEIIFGNDVDIDDIIWMGPQPLISDKAASVGVSKAGEIRLQGQSRRPQGTFPAPVPLSEHDPPEPDARCAVRPHAQRRFRGVHQGRRVDEAYQGAVRDRGDRQGLQHRLRHALHRHEDGPPRHAAWAWWSSSSSASWKVSPSPRV